MTKAEAIGYLLGEYVVVHDGNEYEKELNEALDMAIEALQREEAEANGYCHRIKPKADDE